MSNPGNSEVLSLNDLLKNKLATFERANQLTGEALAKHSQGDFPQTELDQINQLLEQIRPIDAQIQVAIQHVSQSPDPTGVRQALKAQLQLEIGQLMEKSKILEDRIRDSKEGLTPRINQQVAASKMMRAYHTNTE